MNNFKIGDTVQSVLSKNIYKVEDISINEKDIFWGVCIKSSDDTSVGKSYRMDFSIMKLIKTTPKVNKNFAAIFK